MVSRSSGLFDTKIQVHDRKQLELKLEYQPSGTDEASEYFIETLLFIPRSLNIDVDTWSRDHFYADLQNYVRLKTPVLSFDEILTGSHSPLVQLEQRLPLGLMGPVGEVVYDAKMLSCIFRVALRGFGRSIQKCKANGETLSVELHAGFRKSLTASQGILNRFRSCVTQLVSKYEFDAKVQASLRLVDEYMSVLLEQYFRRNVVLLEGMGTHERNDEFRREMMKILIAEESYRRSKGLPSVLSPTGNNEEYSQRIGLLKKFCMNILFLKVQRSATRKRWEEVIFAIAAGGSMSFALAVGFFAQSRYPQASFNFFVLAVVGYMFKDRLKEGLRRMLASYAGKFLYERTNRIIEPVTQGAVGVCSEKVDYGLSVTIPPVVAALRSREDVIQVAMGEMDETVIRYRKKVNLDCEMLPRIADGLISGVTDIIRLNVDRLLRDMDDPEYSLEYVDFDDLSIGKLQLPKSYLVDVAFLFSVDDGFHRSTTVRLVRVVLDRNGIKRMTELVPETLVDSPLKRERHRLNIWGRKAAVK